MNRKAAKELLHIEGWLDRSAEIVTRGKGAYVTKATQVVADRAGHGQHGHTTVPDFNLHSA